MKAADFSGRAFVGARAGNSRRIPRCSQLAFGVAVSLSGLVSGWAERIPWTSSRLIGSPEPPAACRTEPAFPSLRFNEPVALAWAARSDRWFVGQLNGELRSFANRPDVAGTEPVGNLRDLHPELTQFLDFTFHPGFATNRFLFAAYTEALGGSNRWVLARFTVTATEPPRLDPASERVIISSHSGGHDGSCVRFGPDGMIYASLGDATSPDPPDALKTGQDLSDLLASVIRIDVDHPERGRAYRVPADNPFVYRPGLRPEVWAYGFRNPWRMGFGDGGALWVADVGWELWETVHRVTAGYNGGWALVEGPNPAVRNDVKPGPTPIAKPAASHPHSEAASITGGVVYRGRRLPAFRGHFIYGDWETGKIWALADRPGAQPVELADTPFRIVTFFEDADGEVLFADYSNASGLYRLIPNADARKVAEFPRQLSRTGLFTDTAKQEPASGVVPYGIAVPRWADGATSERWLAVPGQGTVTPVWSDDPNSRRWQFPANTVLAKTYSAELSAGEAASRRRLETQVLHFNGEAWAAYSYRWNDAQTDAELVGREGDTATWVQKDAAAPGGTRELAWRFAARAECLRCHNPWAGNVLALNFEQLLAPSKQTDLQRLVQSGVVAEPERWDRPHLAPASRVAAPLEHRARSWLHANCAHCHRFGAGGSVASYFNFDAKLADARLLNHPAARGNFGLEDASVIVPGQPGRSVLWFRLNTEGQGHMPHLGSRRTDEAGSRLVADWIESLGSVRSPETYAAGSATDALAVLRRSQQQPELLAPAVAAARSSTNAFVRELFERFLPDAERRRVLGDDFDPRLVLGLAGDARRGEALFHSGSGPQCARCHVHAGKGRTYGPDLTDIRREFPKAADVLAHIVNPSQQVAPEYQLHLVETKDGESLSGFIVGKVGGELRLRIESGETRTLGQAQVASVLPVAGSAMPEGLLANFTAQEAADLLAFLLRSSERR
jgi:putative heme-binding domain-containing protein